MTQTNKNAFVTLATSDEYAIGGLVLAQSIRNVGTQADIVILVSSGVSPALVASLTPTFTKVVRINELVSGNTEILNLINRPELSVTISKIHAWTLTEYEKAVFLDADCLVLKPIDELFERNELSAVCDLGWPDCFNSGVFVFKPAQHTFDGLLNLAKTEDSFDGGDQGLLNVYFSDWLDSDIGKRLSFIYNMHSSAQYTYLPAFRKFGERVKIVHFLGAVKPWMYNYNKQSGEITSNFMAKHNMSHVTQWWNVFAHQVRESLPSDLTQIWQLPDSLASFLREITTFSHPEPPPTSSFCHSFRPDAFQPHAAQPAHHLSRPADQYGHTPNPNFSSDLTSRLNDLCSPSHTSTNLNESNQTQPVSIADQQPADLHADDEQNEDEQSDDEQNEQIDEELLNEGGIAGQLASLEIKKQEEDYERKKNWETGGLIDYLGVDAFENIQKKIEESIGKP